MSLLDYDLKSSYSYDFHCWNVCNKTGKIIDGDTTEELKPYYDYIALTRFGHTDYELTHLPWNTSTVPKSKMKDFNRGLVEFRGQLAEMEERFPNEFNGILGQIKGTYGNCSRRAYLNKFHYKLDCKIIIGSLGLVNTRNGKIWWEHGNGNTDFNAEVDH
jgi:hypothetical protein